MNDFATNYWVARGPQTLKSERVRLSRKSWFLRLYPKIAEKQDFAAFFEKPIHLFWLKKKKQLIFSIIPREPKINLFLKSYLVKLKANHSADFFQWLYLIWHLRSIFCV